MFVTGFMKEDDMILILFIRIKSLLEKIIRKKDNNTIVTTVKFFINFEV